MSDVISVDFKRNAPLLVSRAQACAMLGDISVSHLRRLIKAGELKPVFLNASARPRRSGKLYFRTRDLEALVDSIDHGPGGHDDIANAVAGVLTSMGVRKYKYDASLAWVGAVDQSERKQSEGAARLASLVEMQAMRGLIR